MFGTITMDRTMFAGRALFKRTIQTSLDSINQEFLTGSAAGVAFKRSKLLRQTDQTLQFGVMVIATINGGKKSQNFKIFFLFIGERVTSWID